MSFSIIAGASIHHGGAEELKTERDSCVMIKLHNFLK
jgi:hypothetical protein